MKKTHEERMTEVLKEYVLFDKDYKLDELDDYAFYYNVPTPEGKNTDVVAHFYFPQDSLNPDELEVVWVKDISRVCGEKAMLVDFIRAIAEGKQPNAVEAAEVLSKIGEKNFFQS